MARLSRVSRLTETACDRQQETVVGRETLESLATWNLPPFCPVTTDVRRLLKVSLIVSGAALWADGLLWRSGDAGPVGWVLSASVPQLFALPPAVVSALALRRRSWVAAGLAGTAAGLQVVGPMGLCLGRPAAGTAGLRVVSYNVGQFKETPEDSQEGIAAAIRRLDPDVACLQEASQNGELQPPTRLMALLPRYHFYAASGMAIASKRPIRRAETRLFASHLVPSHWNVQEVWLDGLRVVNVHLVPEGWEPPQWPKLPWAGRVERKRRPRSEEIDEVLARVGEGPVVVCGDFNLQPYGPLYRRLAGRMTDAYRATATGFGFTLTSGMPTKRMDYVWTRGVRPLRARVVPLATSDHMPVVAELSRG